MLEVLEFSAASSTGSDPMERHPAAAGELIVSDCRSVLQETYGWRPREGPRPGGGRCEVKVPASVCHSVHTPKALRLKVADVGMVEASVALFTPLMLDIGFCQRPSRPMPCERKWKPRLLFEPVS